MAKETDRPANLFSANEEERAAAVARLEVEERKQTKPSLWENIFEGTDWSGAILLLASIVLLVWIVSLL